MGRQSTYKPGFCAVALSAAERGCALREVGEALGVAEATVRLWRSQHDDFAAALKAGTQIADQRVEASLYHRAVGYSFDAVKLQVVCGAVVETPYVEHVPPDTTAAIFWLKNRRPAEWRDKQEVEHSGSLAVDIDRPPRETREEWLARKAIEVTA